MSVLNHLPLFRGRTSGDSQGFATAEWAVLMTFTVMLLAIMVQGLYVENIRATTISTLRDAARVGTREGDLESIVLSAQSSDDLAATQACRDRLVASIAQITQANTDLATCVIDSEGGRYFMEARIGDNFDDVALIPGAQVFKPRLSNLKARFYPRQNAR